MIHDIRYTIYEPRATSGGRPAKPGWTIVEMLIVVAIIALLATMVISLAGRISQQSNEQLIKNTFALLNAALSEFQGYGYNYKDPAYTHLKFPLDCNDLTNAQLVDELEKALQLVGKINISGVGGAPIDHDDDYSGSEALYLFLSQVPDCRQTLERIDKSLITDEDAQGVSMIISIDGQDYPLLRIIDPWGTTLRYSYYDNGPNENSNEPPPDNPRVFPVITSAGANRIFETSDIADDIKSR